MDIVFAVILTLGLPPALYACARDYGEKTRLACAFPALLIVAAHWCKVVNRREFEAAAPTRQALEALIREELP